MKVRNHNGAEIGTIEDDNGYIKFVPRKDWSGYSAYQLEEIAKKMRRLE